MPDNQIDEQQIRIILQEMLVQLAAIYDTNDLKGIKYGARIQGRMFRLTFERDTTLDASSTASTDMERAV
jgi:hypothetical protein